MRRVLFVISLSLLGGCSNLGAIRDISSRLAVASSNWNDVGSDITGSCERQRTINTALTDCELEKKASQGLAGANTILGAYFRALMSAATETNFTVQPGLDAVTTSVSNIPGINTDQVRAVSGLFSLLARLATDKMREDTLRDLISQGSGPARTVIGGMDDLVVPALSRQLDAEKTQLSGYFGTKILSQGDDVGTAPSALCAGAKSSTFSGAGYLLSLEYCRRLAIIDERAKAIDDYRASLKAADKALAELQSSKTKLKAKDLAQRLYVIGTELDEKIAAVRKAFG